VLLGCSRILRVSKPLPAPAETPTIRPCYVMPHRCYRPETWPGPETAPGQVPGATPRDRALSPGPSLAPPSYFHVPQWLASRICLPSHVGPLNRPDSDQSRLARKTRLTCPDPWSIVLAASQGISPDCKPARLHIRGAPGSSAAVHALHHPPPRKSAVPQVTSESSNLKTSPTGIAPSAISRRSCLLTMVRRWVRRLCRSLTDVVSESRPTVLARVALRTRLRGPA
jgi:hypothetical protein